MFYYEMIMPRYTRDSSNEFVSIKEAEKNLEIMGFIQHDDEWTDGETIIKIKRK